MKVTKYLTIESNGYVYISDDVPLVNAGGFTYRLNITLPQSVSQVIGDINVIVPNTTPTLTRRRVS